MLSWLGLLTEPVAVIGWGLLVLTWFSFRRNAATAIRRLGLGVTILYFFVASPLGANLAVGALEGTAPDFDRCRERPPGAWIVVLAGGMRGEAAGPHDFARLHEASFRRTIEAVRLAQSVPQSVLLISGGNGGEVREADLMGSLAASLGLNRSRIVLERASRTTADSAANVARMIESGNPKNREILLVTSALHMRRAQASFQRQGLVVCPVSVDRRFVRPAVHEALIPQISALAKSTDAYHEMAGLLSYLVTGRSE